MAVYCECYTKPIKKNLYYHETVNATCSGVMVSVAVWTIDWCRNVTMKIVTYQLSIENSFIALHNNVR
jgi:hypothetical protein